MTNTTHKFSIGQVVATPGALEALEEAGQTPDFFLQKHHGGDWGCVSTDDAALNDQALLDGSRILSAYRTLKNVKIWLITDAEDDDGKRAYSTLLLPSEY
jgi:hypothetical protein